MTTCCAWGRISLGAHVGVRSGRSSGPQTPVYYIKWSNGMSAGRTPPKKELGMFQELSVCRLVRNPSKSRGCKAFSMTSSYCVWLFRAGAGIQKAFVEGIFEPWSKLPATV